MEEKKGFSITDLYLTLAMVLWGSDYLFAKIAMREISPLSFSAMRTLISTLALLPIFFKREKNWRVPFRHFLYLIGLAFLGTFINRVFWSLGLNLTTASNCALLMTTSPIFVLILSFLFFRTGATWQAVLGILISLAGAFLVIQGDWKALSINPEHFRGDLLSLMAAIVWAFFTVLARSLLKEYSSLKVTAYVMAIGTVLFLPFLPNEKGGGWAEISGLAWLSVFYVAITGNFLGYFLWMHGVKNIGSFRTMLYQYLLPITAMIFAVPFLNETISSIQIWGTLLVFAGIFLARSR